MNIFFQRKIVKYFGNLKAKKIVPLRVTKVRSAKELHDDLLFKENLPSYIAFKSFESPLRASKLLDVGHRPKLVKCLVTKNTTTPFFNFTFDKGRLKNLVSWTLENYGQYKTVELLEQLKKTGFEYATKAGISLGIDDLKIPPKKKILLLEAEQLTKLTIHQYQRGDITAVERFQRLIDTWHRTSEQLKQEVINHFEETDILNPVYMMAFSGARGNISQVRQLVGMRGLMSDPQGQIIDFPIQSNFREGLTLTEYIISSYGARKGIVDTALRTANAGYLTRRLVDVAQHVIISHYDCGTHKGIFLTDMKEGNKTIVSAQNRIIGRVLARDIYKPNSTIKIASRNQEISTDVAFEIGKITNRIFVRSSLTCNTTKLLCQLCYGWSLAQGNLVSVGEAVGVIAAQSIGEPGTQLTMRTFHTGGVFSGDVSDEIRAPYNGFVYYENKIPGILIRTLDGKILFLTKSEGTLIFTTDQAPNGRSKENSSYEIKKYKIPAYTLLFIRNGESVLQKQVLAQITLVSTKTNMRDTAELVIKSELEGLFYAKNLHIQKKILGPKPKFVGEDKQNVLLDPKAMEIIVKARGWNFAWVLSGKRYEFPLLLKSFASNGDLITLNTIMAKNNLTLSSPFLNVGNALQVNNATNLTKLPLLRKTSRLGLLTDSTGYSMLQKYTTKQTKVNKFGKQDLFYSYGQKNQINVFAGYSNLPTKKSKNAQNAKLTFIEKLNLSKFFKQYSLKTKTKLTFYSLAQTKSLSKTKILQSKQLEVSSFVKKKTAKLLHKIQLEQSLFFLKIKKMTFYKMGYFQVVNPNTTAFLVSKSNRFLKKKNGVSITTHKFTYNTSYNDIILLPTALNLDLTAKKQIALKRFKPAYNLFQWFYPNLIKQNLTKLDFFNSLGQVTFHTRYSKMDFLKVLKNPFKVSVRKPLNAPLWVSKYSQAMFSRDSSPKFTNLEGSLQNQANLSTNTVTAITENASEKNTNHTNMYKFFLKQQILKSYKKRYKKYNFEGVRKQLKEKHYQFSTRPVLYKQEKMLHTLVFKKWFKSSLVNLNTQGETIPGNPTQMSKNSLQAHQRTLVTRRGKNTKRSKINRLLRMDNYIKKLTTLKTSNISHTKHNLRVDLQFNHLKKSIQTEGNLSRDISVNPFPLINFNTSCVKDSIVNNLISSIKPSIQTRNCYHLPITKSSSVNYSLKTNRIIKKSPYHFTFFEYFKLNGEQSGTKAIFKHFKFTNIHFNYVSKTPLKQDGLYFKTKTQANLKLLKLVLEEFYKKKIFGAVLAKNLKILNRNLTLTKNNLKFLLYYSSKLTKSNKNIGSGSATATDVYYLLKNILTKTNPIKISYAYLVPMQKVTTPTKIRNHSGRSNSKAAINNHIPQRVDIPNGALSTNRKSKLKSQRHKIKITKNFNQLKLEAQFVIILLSPKKWVQYSQQMQLNKLGIYNKFNSNLEMLKVTLLTNFFWLNKFQSKSTKQIANKDSNPLTNLFQENYISLVLSHNTVFNFLLCKSAEIPMLTKFTYPKGNSQEKNLPSDNKKIVFDLEKLQRIILTEQYKSNLRWVKNKKARFLPKDIDINTLEVNLHTESMRNTPSEYRIQPKNKLTNLIYEVYLPKGVDFNKRPQSHSFNSLSDFVTTIKLNEVYLLEEATDLSKGEKFVVPTVSSTQNGQPIFQVSNTVSFKTTKLLKLITTSFMHAPGSNQLYRKISRIVFIIKNKADKFMAKQKKDLLLLPKNSTIKVLIKPQNKKNHSLPLQPYKCDAVVSNASLNANKWELAKHSNPAGQSLFTLGQINFGDINIINPNLTYLKKNIYFNQTPFFDSPFSKASYLFSYTAKSIKPSFDKKNSSLTLESSKDHFLKFKVLNIPKQPCLNICFKSNSNIMLNSTTNSLCLTKTNDKLARGINKINLLDSLKLKKFKVDLLSARTLAKSNNMIKNQLFKSRSILQGVIHSKNVVTQTHYFSPFEGELLYTKTYKNYLDLNPYESLKIGLMQLNTPSSVSTLLLGTKKVPNKKSKQNEVYFPEGEPPTEVGASRCLHTRRGKLEPLRATKVRELLEEAKLTQNESVTKVALTQPQIGKTKTKTEKMRMAMFKYYLKRLNSQKIIGNKGWSRFNLILTKKDLITLKYNTLESSFTLFSEIQKHSQQPFKITKPIRSSDGVSRRDARSISYNEVCLNYLFATEITNPVKLQTVAQLNKEMHFNKSYYFNLKNLWLKHQFVTNVSTSQPIASHLAEKERINPIFSLRYGQHLLYKVKILLLAHALNLEHTLWSKDKSLQRIFGYKNDIMRVNKTELSVLPTNVNYNLKWINYKQKNMFTKNKVGFFFLKGNTFFNTSQKLFNTQINKQTTFFNSTIYNFGHYNKNNLLSSNSNFLENTNFVDLSLCLDLQKIYLNKNYLNIKPILDKKIYGPLQVSKLQKPTNVLLKKTHYYKKQHYYLQLLNSKNHMKVINFFSESGTISKNLDSSHLQLKNKEMHHFINSYSFLKPLNIDCAHYIKQEIVTYNDLITNFKDLNMPISLGKLLKSLNVFFINTLKIFITNNQLKVDILSIPTNSYSEVDANTTNNLFQVIKQSGQLIQMNKEKITLRLGQPLVISPRSTIHATHGDFIRYKTPVITLTYQQLKTGDIVQGIPKIEQLFEARTTKRGRLFRDNVTNLLTGLFLKYFIKSTYLLRKTMIGFSKNRWKKGIKYTLPESKNANLASVNYKVGNPFSRHAETNIYQTKHKISINKRLNYSNFVNNKQNQTIILALALQWAVKQSFYKIQQIIVDGILRVYRSQGVSIADKHVEIVVKQMTSKVRIINSNASKMSEYLFSLDTIKAGELPETDLPKEEVSVQPSKAVSKQKPKKSKKGLKSKKLSTVNIPAEELPKSNKRKSNRKKVSLFEGELTKLENLSNTPKPIQISQVFEQKVLNQLLANNLDGPTGLFPGEIVDIDFVENINTFLLKTASVDRASREILSTDPLNPNNQVAFAIEPIKYEPIVLGITRASLEVESFLSAASFQQTTRVLSQAALYKKKDFLKGLKENIIIGNLIPAGTGFLSSLNI
jgi:hypothetical protein